MIYITVNQIKKNLTQWSKDLQVSSQFLYDVHKVYGLSTLEKVITNIANDKLIELDKKLIEINNQKFNLYDWSKLLHFSKLHLIKYAYFNGLEKTKEYIKQCLPSDNVSFQQRGKILTINRLSNNYSAWIRLTDINWLHKYDEEEAKEVIKRSLTRVKDKDSLTINELTAPFKNWSLFIGQNETLVKDLIIKYGEVYTKNFIQKELNNNTYTNVVITINNQSHTIRQWSKILKMNSPNNLYILKRFKGIDYLTNFIANKLKKLVIDNSPTIEVNFVKRTLNEWAQYFNKSNKYLNSYYDKYGYTETVILIRCFLQIEALKYYKKETVKLTVDDVTKSLNEWSEYFLYYIDILKYYNKHGEEETKQFIKRVMNNEENIVVIDKKPWLKIAPDKTRICIINGMIKTIEDWASYVNIPDDYLVKYYHLYGCKKTAMHIKQFVDNNQIISFKYDGRTYIYIDRICKSIEKWLNTMEWSYSYFNHLINTLDKQTLVNRIFKRLEKSNIDLLYL